MTTQEDYGDPVASLEKLLALAEAVGRLLLLYGDMPEFAEVREAFRVLTGRTLPKERHG